MCVCVRAGLSQTQPVLLLAAGGSDTGSYELHRQPGASCGHVHPVVHIGRTHGAR